MTGREPSDVDAWVFVLVMFGLPILLFVLTILSMTGHL